MSRSRSAPCSKPPPSRLWPNVSTRRGGTSGAACCCASGRDPAVVCAAPAVVHRPPGRASATYTIPLAVRLKGGLDREALEAALGDVVERHESLRTIFPDTLGVPRQLILDASAARPRLAVVSVSEEALPEALSAAARQGFDLASEPPLRAHLFVLGESEHVVLLLLHHIAGDGWSMAPLARDLAGFYAARCRGTAPDLPALPVQYADYTLWQHEVLGEESDPESAIARQLAYWTSRLQDLPEQLDLPLRPAPTLGVELSRGQRAAAAGAGAARRSAGAGARQRGEPVHGAAGGPCGLAHAAGCGHRHPDRQPDRGTHRQRARRSRRFLRQHPGAAHRHVRQSELPRADRAGAREQSFRLRPSGLAVRAAGGGHQPGTLAVAPSAVPGDAGAAEQRAGEPGPAGAGGCG